MFKYIQIGSKNRALAILFLDITHFQIVLFIFFGFLIVTILTDGLLLIISYNWFFVFVFFGICLSRGYFLERVLIFIEYIVIDVFLHWWSIRWNYGIYSFLNNCQLMHTFLVRNLLAAINKILSIRSTDTRFFLF